MSRKQFREDRQGIKTEPGLKAAKIVVTRDDNNLEGVQGMKIWLIFFLGRYLNISKNKKWTYSELCISPCIFISPYHIISSFHVKKKSTFFTLEVSFHLCTPPRLSNHPFSGANCSTSGGRFCSQSLSRNKSENWCKEFNRTLAGLSSIRNSDILWWKVFPKRPNRGVFLGWACWGWPKGLTQAMAFQGELHM